MKRLAMILVFCMVFSLMSSTDFKVNAEQSGDFSYTIIDSNVKITKYLGVSTSVVIPDVIEGNKVTSIGEFAFYNCFKLESIMLPDSLKSIDAFAFESCTKLTNVSIPKNVSKVSQAAFMGCSKLIDISVDNENLIYSSQEGVLFDSNKSTIIQYPNGKTGIYTIPSSVIKISDYAFAMSAGLAYVIIPDSVTTIGPFSFYFCKGLTELTIPNNVTTIGIKAFSYCLAISSINIGTGLRIIDYGTFMNCIAIPNITIPANISQIKDQAFMNCRSLVLVNYSGTFPNIGYKVFQGCAPEFKPTPQLVATDKLSTEPILQLSPTMTPYSSDYIDIQTYPDFKTRTGLRIIRGNVDPAYWPSIIISYNQSINPAVTSTSILCDLKGFFTYSIPFNNNGISMCNFMLAPDGYKGVTLDVSLPADCFGLPTPSPTPTQTPKAPAINVITDKIKSISGTSISGGEVVVTVGAEKYSANVVSGKWKIVVTAVIKAGTKVSGIAKVGNLTSAAKSVYVIPATPIVNKVKVGATKVTGTATANSLVYVTMQIVKKVKVNNGTTGNSLVYVTVQTTFTDKASSKGVFSVKVSSVKKGASISVKCKAGGQLSGVRVVRSA